MKFILLTVFLAIMQASVPVPRKATNNHGSGRSNNDQNGQTKKTPSSAPSTINQKPNSVSDQNTKQTVTVIELPAVSIRRDRADWIAWGGGILLTFVGIFGVYAAYRTLRAIQEQARIMGEQREVMMGQLRTMQEQITAISEQTSVAKDSAKAAQDSINIIISKERARLKIRFRDVSLSAATPEILYTAAIYGTTDAFDVETLINLAIISPENPQGDVWYGVPLGLRNVIRCENSEITKSVTFPSFLTKEAANDIYGGKKHVHIRGYIRYKDVFDNSWIINFQKMWIVVDRLQYWKDYGPKEANEETKAN